MTSYGTYKQANYLKSMSNHSKKTIKASTSRPHFIADVHRNTSQSGGVQNHQKVVDGHIQSKRWSNLIRKVRSNGARMVFLASNATSVKSKVLRYKKYGPT